jgi:DnaJ like chaperone protein
MAKFGKWVGGALGWAMGGPIGGILGFVIGSMLDEAQVTYTRTPHAGTTRPGDFAAALLVLSAAVMKSDGRTMKSELEYVRQFFAHQFSAAYARQQMLLLREILKKEIPLREVCRQVKQYMNYSARLQLLHYLFGISKADGHVHDMEVKAIEEIAGYMGINHADFGSIKAMYFRDTDADYKILEITPHASDEEVKKAYRRMALKYHPDKVSHLGEEVQKAAKEKFQKVQEAYENIKKKRGMP